MKRRWLWLLLLFIIAAASIWAITAHRHASEARAAQLRENPAQALRQAQSGAIVTFGAWEDDPIRWIVLERDDDRVLLLSEQILACMPYHDAAGDITWAECSLRAWLNSAFAQTAFNDAERQLLIQTQNENPDEDVHGTRGGADTTDRVFLLSEAEARAVLKSDEARTLTGMAVGTETALAQGLHVSEDNDCSPWWLRSPGTYQDSAVFVASDGTVNETGAIVTIDYYCGVRPAIWIQAK